jgi:hypothetical protein
VEVDAELALSDADSGWSAQPAPVVAGVGVTGSGVTADDTAVDDAVVADGVVAVAFPPIGRER